MTEPADRPSPRKPPPTWLFWLLLLLPALVIALRVAPGGFRLGGGGDLDLMYRPYWAYLGQSLRHGRLPLWDPDMGLGIPFAASPQSQTLYPPAMLIFAALPLDPAVLLFCLGHILLLALGVERLARRMGWERPASLCAGALAAGAPFVFSSILRPNSLCAEAWLPWMLLAAIGACEGRKNGATWLALGVALGIASASPETTLLGVAAILVLGVARDWQGQRGALLRCLLGIAIGVGLAAVAWVPFLELLGHSNRGEEIAGMQTAWSVRVGDLGNLVLPFLKSHTVARTRRDFLFGPFQYDFHTLYFGVSVLVLARAARRATRWTWLLRGVILVSLLLGMFGGHLGQALQAWDLLPFGWRYPVKFVAPASLALALGGAAGAAALATGQAPDVRRLARWLAAAGGLLALVAALLVPRIGPALPVSLAWDGCVLLLLAAALRWVPVGGWRLWALTLVCLVDVGVACLPFRLPSDLGRCPEVAAAAKARAGGGRVDALCFDFPDEQSKNFEAESGLAECLCGNVLAEYGVPSTSYYGTPNPAGSFDPGKGALLDVTLVLRGHPEDRAETRPLAAPELAPLWVAAVPGAAPRLELRPAARVLAPGDIEEALEKDTPAQARAEVLLEVQPPPPSAAGERYEGEDHATLAAETPERLTIETASSGERYLVIADRFYPGWAAMVDGQPAEILRAYGLLRALRLGPGRHHVVLDFRPQSLRWGVGASLLSALLLVASAVGRYSRKA